MAGALETQPNIHVVPYFPVDNAHVIYTKKVKMRKK
jgi:hypothetical protein